MLSPSRSAAGLAALVALLTGSVLVGQAARADPLPDPPIQVLPGPAQGGVVGIGVHNQPVPGGPGNTGGAGSSGGAGRGSGAEDICGDPNHTAICAAFIQQFNCAVIYT